jgi:V-type H+-transporting ATPase subunit C
MSYNVWVVASACSAGDDESILAALQTECQKFCTKEFLPTKFDVPTNLKFGSFDNLVKLCDDVAKMDSQVESVLRRVERQLLELNPDADRKVLSQRKQQSWDNYTRNFPWDDAKFPRSRPINDSLQLLMTSVQRLDEEVRTRASSYNELKTAHQNAQKKDQSSYATRELLDVLTPGNTDANEFVNTEHLLTSVVMVPRGAEKEWLKCYETLESNVVPASSKQFKCGTDKDGNTLWRVIMFKSSLEGFKKAARERKFLVRDFKLDAELYKKTLEDRAATEAEVKKQETFLTRVCQAAFSDTLVSWMHLKATRIFVEATLRTGAPPCFAAYAMKPLGASEQKKLHAKMISIFTASGLGYGDKYTAAGVKDEEAEEYYPYVFFPFSPVG